MSASLLPRRLVRLTGSRALMHDRNPCPRCASRCGTLISACMAGVRVLEASLCLRPCPTRLSESEPYAHTQDGASVHMYIETSALKPPSTSHMATPVMGRRI